MGVVCQIKDLDNSSSAVPYKTHISSTDAVCDPTPYCGTSTSAVPYKAHISSTDVLHDPTPCRGSTKALPYKFTATSIVGEGLAPPETSVKMTL